MCVSCSYLSDVMALNYLCCVAIPHNKSIKFEFSLKDSLQWTYLGQTEVQQFDGFKNKTGGFLWINVLHIPGGTEKFMQHSVNKSSWY